MQLMDRDVNVNVGGFDVKVHIHGRFHTLFEYVYDGTASGGGIPDVKSKHWKSHKGACEHALKDWYAAMVKAGKFPADSPPWRA